MQVAELIQILEELAPAELACSWDNVGLQAGRRSSEVHKVYVALDATDQVVEDAAAQGCDFLLTHHPLIFEPLRKVNEDTLAGRRLLRMIESGMSYYAMHTSYDAAPEGMAARAARRLGLTRTVPMEPAGSFDENSAEPAGIGRVGTLAAPMTVKELASFVKERFSLPFVTLYGGEENPLVERVAVLPGSGKGEIDLARQLGVQVYVTGDLGHHPAIDAAAWGLPLIDAGHAGLEWIFIPHLKEYLQQRAPELKVVTGPIAVPGQLI